MHNLQGAFAGPQVDKAFCAEQGLTILCARQSSYQRNAHPKKLKIWGTMEKVFTGKHQDDEPCSHLSKEACQLHTYTSSRLVAKACLVNAL